MAYIVLPVSRWTGFRMFEGMSVLRKEEKARAGRSEKAKELEEYLQNKYTGRKDKSKKTRKKKSSPRNITIRDMDVSGFATVAPCQTSDGEEQDGIAKTKTK